MEHARAGSRTREFPSLDWRPSAAGAPAGGGGRRRPAVLAAGGQRGRAGAAAAGAIGGGAAVRRRRAAAAGAGRRRAAARAAVGRARCCCCGCGTASCARRLAHERWRTPAAAGLGLLALLGCLRAHGVRHDLAGQIFAAVVATAGAADYLWRLRGRQRSLGGWLRLAAGALAPQRRRAGGAGGVRRGDVGLPGVRARADRLRARAHRRDARAGCRAWNGPTCWAANLQRHRH